MKQMVVGLLFVAAIFTVGPWFAGKVGPTLADAITDYAQQQQPCATASATPTKRPHAKHKPGARHHTKPHRKHRPTTKPSATPSPSCEPTATPRQESTSTPG
jgi:hypothetical protein